MTATSIQWTDHSINPIRARDKETGRTGHYCEKISSGCAYCYASALQRRFGMPEFGVRIAPPLSPVSQGDRMTVNSRLELFFDRRKLHEVCKRRKPTKYFWCDMTDLFGPWVPDHWIDECFATMAMTPQHTHQVLTKRPERMHLYCRRRPLHLPNVWLGVSCENQARADERIPVLLDTPAAVRFVSAEPLLGEIDLRHLQPEGIVEVDVLAGTHGVIRPHRGENQRLDWVIVGGESGPGARPCSLDWILSIVGQCKAANVAAFVKQFGSHPIGSYHQRLEMMGEHRIGNDVIVRWKLGDKKGGDPAEWPAEMRVRQYPETRGVRGPGTGDRERQAR